MLRTTGFPRKFSLPLAAPSRFTTVRRCSSASASGSSDARGPTHIFGGFIRSVLTVSIGVTLSSLCLVIFSWPVIDALVMPAVFRRAIMRGSEQFSRFRNEPPPSSSSSSSSEWQSQVEALSRALESGDRSLIVLNGPAACGKSEVVKRLCARDGRPVLYIDMRGLLSPSTTLHAILTYLLVNLGISGQLWHSYIKIANAFLDLVTTNNHHEHNSAIFLAMSLGHVRAALRKIVAQKSERQRPLVVLDGLEQFCENRFAENETRSSVQRECEDMLVTFFVRAALSEQICSLLVVADSSCFASASSGRRVGNSAPPVLPAARPPVGGGFFHGSDCFERWLARHEYEDQLALAASAAADGGDSFSLKHSKINAFFPCLLGRSSFIYLTPGQDAFAQQNAKSSAYQSVLRAACHSHDRAPPLLFPAVLDVMARLGGGVTDAAQIVDELDFGGSVSDALNPVLSALEDERVIHRVCGQPLLQGGAPQLSTLDTSARVLFVPCGSFLKDPATWVEAGRAAVWVDVQVPLRDTRSAKKFSGSSDDFAEMNSNSILKRVRLTPDMSGEEILKALSHRSCDPWPGTVDVVTGVTATCPKDVKRDSLSWRSGHLLGRSFADDREKHPLLDAVSNGGGGGVAFADTIRQVGLIVLGAAAGVLGTIGVRSYY